MRRVRFLTEPKPASTIRQPIPLIAETATEALLNRIRQPTAAPRSIQLDVDLIVRTSTNRTGVFKQVVE